RLLRLAPGRTGPGRLERAVERVYESGMYGRVWYELQADGPDTVAVVHAEPREANRVGFGFRYDERYDASLLFTATLRSLLGYGSETRFDARLGEQLQFGVRSVRRGVLSSPLTLGASASYTRSPFDLFEEGRRVATADVVVGAAAFTAGLELLGNAGLAAQLAGQRVSGARPFTSADSVRERALASISGLAWWSGLDREEFPRQGVRIFARSEAVVAGASFAHHVADVRGAVPLTRRFTLQTRATAGATTGGDDIPVSYRFFLGGSTASGAFPETQLAFPGLQPQERMGTAVARLQGALQWEAVPNVYATLTAAAGNVGATLRSAAAHPIVGMGVSLGSQTILGPIELSLGGRSLGEWPRVGVNIGYVF
ncbi:MAG TPA: BamA/TamA family outer membrane protein, partial [Gemmatimonadaceae bacterium]|nr:BamA/TamA family outer membrane protein [Gemmatimonadaceae bacterium]